MDQLMLTVSEAAKLCSLGRTAAYELVRARVWPSVRVGRGIRIPAEELRRWVEAQTDPPIDRMTRARSKDFRIEDDEDGEQRAVRR